MLMMHLHQLSGTTQHRISPVLRLRGDPPTDSNLEGTRPKGTGQSQQCHLYFKNRMRILWSNSACVWFRSLILSLGNRYCWSWGNLNKSSVHKFTHDKVPCIDEPKTGLATMWPCVFLAPFDHAGTLGGWIWLDLDRCWTPIPWI